MKSERTLREKLRIYQLRIVWYHSVLIWALNRCENTPQTIIQLFRDKSTDYSVEANSEVIKGK